MMQPVSSQRTHLDCLRLETHEPGYRIAGCTAARSGLCRTPRLKFVRHGRLIGLCGCWHSPFSGPLNAYWSQKPALKLKHASLKRRLQLFDTIITTSLLWGAESWTTTQQQRDELDALQRWTLRDFGTTLAPRRNMAGMAHTHPA